jgi:methionyl-tRNA formyltransferase
MAHSDAGLDLLARPYRIVFMGTPEFALPTLAGLVATQNVVAVFTQPDRPAGRGRTVRSSPVKDLALAHGLPVHQPVSLRKDAAAVDALTALDADVVVVVAYGLILPPSALGAARHGCVNVHASLLPRWRGAAPINHAILAGDRVTGVTIMCLDTGLDTGPVLTRAEVGIAADESAGELSARLAEIGADLLVRTLPGYLRGEIVPVPQDPAGASTAPRLAAEDGRLDWRQPAVALARRVRAMNPWPGAFTELADGTRLKIHTAGVIAEGALLPATVTATTPTTPDGAVDPVETGRVTRVGVTPAVTTGDGRLRLDVVQLAGRRAQPGAEFLRGRPDLVGAVLASVPPTTA